MPGRKPEVFVDRFWEKVQKTDSCWLWTGCRNTRPPNSNYGVITTRAYPVGGKWKTGHCSAHRIAWMLLCGDPGDACVLHRCDNPPCVNPAHLFLGDMLDNTKDMFAKGRASLRDGEHNGRSRLTIEQVKTIRAAKGTRSNKELAQEYGVGCATISHIMRGATWKGVTV